MGDSSVEEPHEPGASATTPTITPRRGLPNGRAPVGALLVTTAAIGAFALATQGDDGPDTEFFVLLRDIEPGDSVGLDDVGFESMTLSPAVADVALSSTNGVDGATALRWLRAGELLTRHDLHGAAFVDGAPVVDIHELTFPVRLDRTPADLRRGDRVTVLATDGDGTWLALEDALVLTFDTDTGGIGSTTEARLTVGLTAPGDVLRGAHLSFLDLTVVLTNQAIGDEYPEYLAAPSTAPSGSDEEDG